MLRDFSSIAVSNLFLNLITFLLMLTFAKTMSVVDFTTLSVALSVSLFGAVFFDFGLNVATVREYGIKKRNETLFAMLNLKWLIFVFNCIIIGLLYIFLPSINASFEALMLGLLGGGLLNLWMGYRVVEQCKLNFSSYAYSNMAFAIARAISGSICILLGLSGAESYLVTFLFGGVIFLAPRLLNFRFKFGFSWGDLALNKRVGGYAIFAYISALTYSLSLYVPQYFVYARLDNESAAAYGLVMSFLGIVSLLATSFRAVVLPNIFSDENKYTINYFKSSLLKWCAPYLMIMIMIIYFGGCAIDFFYAEQMPTAGSIFRVCSFGLLVTVYIGFFNIFVHKIGRPEIEMKSNIFRAFLMIFVLGLYGYNLYDISLQFCIIMIMSEFITAIYVSRAAEAKLC